METFAAKHADKIRGTLGCFDRVLFRGYLPLMSGFAMADFLKSKQVDRVPRVSMAKSCGWRGRRFP